MAPSRRIPLIPDDGQAHRDVEPVQVVLSLRVEGVQPR